MINLCYNITSENIKTGQRTNYPYIVCTSNERILGYAYAHRHRERAAYQWNAELSVYVDKPYNHQGIGKALYSALMEILKLQNIKNVYGAVTTPNENSEKLHEALAFKKLGAFHSTGYKCGAWHDVAFFEKHLGEYDINPEPFIPIGKVNPSEILKILSYYSNTIN